MRKSMLAALCLATLTTTAPVWAAGVYDNYSETVKYNPPVADEVKAADNAVPGEVRTTTITGSLKDKDAAKAADTKSDEAASVTKTAQETKAGSKKNKKAADKETEAAQQQALPIVLTCDRADYENDSGDFDARGNVKVVQGKETLLSTRAVGNLKTGDIWLNEGGTLIEPTNKVDGGWVHYNFNTKTGEIKKINGKSMDDYYQAPHANITPGAVIIDQGGTSTRCPAVKHTPCLSVAAKTITIYPGEKMVAKDVKVYVKGIHVYSRDTWINDFNKDTGERLMPRVGFKSKDDGMYISLELEHKIGKNFSVYTDQVKYTRAGYKPIYGASYDSRNFVIRWNNGWSEDSDDNWLHKQMDWGFYLKGHRLDRKWPLSYSAYLTHGLWKYENNNYSSWHTEKAFYLNHDRIHLFNTKNNTLDLTIGRKWVHESYTDENTSTNMYYATYGHVFDPKWNLWAGYYREDLTSSLFNYGQPDMAKELRVGVQHKFDDRNTLTLVNRYDLGKSQRYDTALVWSHRFCCWVINLEYRDKKYNDSKAYYVSYNFLYW